MAIIKDGFGKLRTAIQSIGSRRETRMAEAAKKIGELLFDAVLWRQPHGKKDSWDQSTTSSERQGHTPISQGWGLGPQVFIASPNEVKVTLENKSEHIQFLVWSVGGVKRPWLGTQQHWIPLEGGASEVYGHPLAFWWERGGGPVVRERVDHPGTMGTLGSQFGGMDFIQQAWQDVAKDAGEIAHEAARRPFEGLRELFRQ